jgi:hypothetical protein
MPPSEHLEDLTNEPRPLCLPPSLVDTKRPPSLHVETSSRIHRLHLLDSSEFFPSEHTSICDAEPVVSDKHESLEVSECDDETNPNVPPSHAPQSSIIENIAPHSQQHLSPAENALQALNVHFNLNRQWPATRLDTITERLSQKTPRTSVSRPGAVSASLDWDSGDAAAASSIPRPAAQRGLVTSRYRSFSLNDLDCRKPSKAQHVFVHDSSSSSGDALRAACLCEAYPINPMEPPPVRVPTPPGLPTFGTKEAMEYRMPSPKRTSWIPPWRKSRMTVDTPGPPANMPAASPVEATDTPATLTDGLKRLLGITRVISPIPEEPRRVGLPLYLARADDGTYVRGRFGARHSAHGSHRAQLDAHPFHHRDVDHPSGTRQSNLDRVIQEIDKACAESERQRLVSVSPRTRGQSAPRSGNVSSRLLPPGQRALTIAEALSQQPPPPPNTPVSPDVGPRSHDQAMRSHPLVTFDRLGSGGSIRSQSTTAGIDGVRHFVEQAERVSLEQNRQLTQEKEQRSKCANCWFAFWICCCDMEDPDRWILDSGRVMSPETGFSAVQSPEIRTLTRRIVYEQPPRRGERGMAYH